MSSCQEGGVLKPPDGTRPDNVSCELLVSSSNTTDGLPADFVFFQRPEEMLIPWRINEYFFPIIITYIITFIIGVAGNGVAITVMAGDRASRNVTSIFLVSLAAADLLLLVICAPLDVAHYFVVQWDQEGTVCKLAAYAEMVSAFASVLNLMAVTLERFVVIVFPIRSRSVCTMSNCKKIMIGVWIVSLLMAGPAIATKNTLKTTFSNFSVTVTLFSCKEMRDWRGLAVAIYRLVTLFALPSVLMIVCYAWVILELWVSTRTMDELTNTSGQNNRMTRSNSRTSISQDSHSPSHNQRLIIQSQKSTEVRDVKRARQQVIKMLILVVVLFLVCWGPRLVMEIVLKCCLDVFNHGTYSIRCIFYLLPFVHSCLNPIVYCFMSTKFRRRMIRCFERTCGRACVASLRCRGYSSSTSSSRRQMHGSISRNGTTRLGSTYTFTSYATSSTFSPSAEAPTKMTDLETITL